VPEITSRHGHVVARTAVVQLTAVNKVVLFVEQVEIRSTRSIVSPCLTPYGEKPVVVPSGRPLDLSSARGTVVEQMSGEPDEIATRPEERGFEHAYIGGGLTIQRLPAAGLINILLITRIQC
jgi:hypothetical protein